MLDDNSVSSSNWAPGVFFLLLKGYTFHYALIVSRDPEHFSFAIDFYMEFFQMLDWRF